MMKKDTELLSEYCTKGSQSAFTEVVQRNVDLAYSVALRHACGDSHLAEEAVQSVFTDLARKARELSAHPVLSAWIFKSTHFAASSLMRTERRRLHRLQQRDALQEMVHPESESTLPSDALRVVIDQIISELGDDERDAVILRFFQGMDYAGIGRELNLSDSGARSRVDRAIEKLHAALARRGVNSTAATVALALSKHMTGAAPTGLAASLAATAVAIGEGTGAGAAASGGSAAFLLGLFKLPVVLGIVALIAGTSYYALLRDAPGSIADEGQSELPSSLVPSPARTNGFARPRSPARPPELGVAEPALARGDALLAKYPHLRALLIESTARRISTIYFPLYAQLGLDQTQITRFEEILLGATRGRTLGLGEDAVKLVPVALTSEDHRETQLRELLGEAGFSQYKQYTPGGFNSSAQVAAAMAFTATPLSREQAVKLAGLFNDLSARRLARDAYRTLLFDQARMFLSSEQMVPLEIMSLDEAIRLELHTNGDPKIYASRLSAASAETAKAQISAQLEHSSSQHSGNPDLQNLTLAKRRAEVALEYAAFLRSVDIGEEHQRLLDALVALEEFRYDVETIRSSRQLPRESSVVTDSLAIGSAQFATIVGEILGSTGYEQWQAYEHSLVPRKFVGAVAGVAAVSGIPFSQKDLEHLTAAIVHASKVSNSRWTTNSTQWAAVDRAAEAILSPEQLGLFLRIDATEGLTRDSEVAGEALTLLRREAWLAEGPAQKRVGIDGRGR